MLNSRHLQSSTFLSSAFVRTLSSACVALAAFASAHAADGVVKKVDAGKGTVKIEHNGVPKLDMPAMAMVFRVSDASALNGIAVGDQVQFEADKVDGKYVVTSIKKQAQR